MFNDLIRERLQEWVDWADQKLPSHDVCQVFMNAGNDDPLFVDDILEKSSKLIHPEGKVIDLPVGLKLLSTGYANKTPWNCPRDVHEAQLKKQIAAMTDQLSGTDFKKAIFNFHCPPKDTALDLADKIDKTLKPAAGLKGAPKVHVGSTAVREAIETWQPLVSLHGHIHQVYAKDWIGKTLCFNPGSDYRTGHLQGVFLQINKAGEVEFDKLTQERDAQGSKKGRSIFETLSHLLPWGIGSEMSSRKTNRTIEVSTQETYRKIDEMKKEVTRLSEEIRSATYLGNKNSK